jgi:DNA-binding Lrp family transcriptional regulator
MVVSYTLVRVQPSKDRDIFLKVKEFPEVKDVITTYGEYDMIIKIEEKTMDDLDEFIFHKLRHLEGIEATTTLIQAKFDPAK